MAVLYGLARPALCFPRAPRRASGCPREARRVQRRRRRMHALAREWQREPRLLSSRQALHVRRLCLSGATELQRGRGLSKQARLRSLPARLQMRRGLGVRRRSDMRGGDVRDEMQERYRVRRRLPVSREWPLWSARMQLEPGLRPGSRLYVPARLVDVWLLQRALDIAAKRGFFVRDGDGARAFEADRFGDRIAGSAGGGEEAAPKIQASGVRGIVAAALTFPAIFSMLAGPWRSTFRSGSAISARFARRG